MPSKVIKYNPEMHERILHILWTKQEGFKADLDLIAKELGTKPHSVREHFRNWNVAYGSKHENNENDGNDEDDDEQPTTPTVKRRKTSTPKTPKTPKTPRSSKTAKGARISAKKVAESDQLKFELGSDIEDTKAKNQTGDDELKVNTENPA